MSVEEKDYGWKRIKKDLKQADKSFVIVGFPAGKVAPLNVKKAIWNEFGTKRKGKEHIPERPFNRYTFEKYLNKMLKFTNKQYNEIKMGNIVPSKALSLMGELYVGLLKLSIRTGPWEKNAPSTEAMKGSTKPLIDTREMSNAISYKVFMRGL